MPSSFGNSDGVMPRIMFVVNSPSFFISHRYAIAHYANKLGYEIHIAGAIERDAILKIEKAGFLFHEITFSRNGKSPFIEFNTIVALYSLFKRVKPDIVHLITIKPYLYGGIVARFVKVPCVVSAVAGLGILFSSTDIKYKLLKILLYPFYRLAFGHDNQKVIFQNINDRDALVNWGVISACKPTLIRGSGVDLRLYSYLPEPAGIPIIAFAARLLVDKGVEIFAEASRILKMRQVQARFWLIGVPDPGNSNTVTEAQLKKWESEELVELFGFRNDIPDLFSQSNIVTLPSFYGEGLPKVLIEAAACGRAVITTDHPGCRDAIEPNKTGLLIPIKDPVALADAIEYLIENPELRKNMGASGRSLAEREFSIEKIVESHMEIYQSLLNKAGLS